jgi:hypothetical protein
MDINVTTTSIQMCCPIWNHECYAERCAAWDKNMNCCSIIEARRFVPIRDAAPTIYPHGI